LEEPRLGSKHFSNNLPNQKLNLREYNHWLGSQEQPLNLKHKAKPMHCDLAIIGGGYTGCSAALEAANKGADVILLEANCIGFGGSGRNVGLVNAGLWLSPKEIEKTLGELKADRLIKALSQAPKQVFDIIKKYNIKCDLTQTGTLHCAHNNKGFKELEKRYVQLKDINTPVELLDQQTTSKLIGSTVFFGSLLDRRAGTIQPLSYCRGLARAALLEGAKIYENQKVHRIFKENNIWKIYTKSCHFSAEKLLVCTNAYAGQLRGIKEYKTSQISYFQAVSNKIPQKIWKKILPEGQGCWDTAPIMTSFRKTSDQRLIIGGMGNAGGIGQKIHHSWAKRKIKTLFPHLAELKLQHYWQGQIAMSNSYIPKIVEIDQNCYQIFGFSGRGIGPGTLLGKNLASSLIKKDCTELPLDIENGYIEPFRPLKTAIYELAAKTYHFLN